MPEAVLPSQKRPDPAEARRVHSELLRSYNADFSKYADDALAERIRRLAGGADKLGQRKP